jgi:glycosyltransferase involved in cell wall biosynthesis
MPVKNGAIHLPACLDSIINQTYIHWELIIVDDHSSDNTEQIIQDYMLSDKRISTCKNHGKGIINALRLAFDKSSGQYITRMDADDIMHEQKIELLKNQLFHRGPGFVAVGLVRYFKEGVIGKGYEQYASWLNHLTINSSNFDHMYRECTIPSPCWMMDKTDLEKIGAFDSHIYPEDYDLAFRMKVHNINLASVNKVIHYWRDHEMRATRNDPNYLDNRFVELKVKYFIESEMNERLLVLWGAGSKGKSIAKQLILRKIRFSWITNNPNKIGQNIYGLKLLSEAVLRETNSKNVIVSISGLNGEKYDSPLMERNNHHSYYFFT